MKVIPTAQGDPSSSSKPPWALSYEQMKAEHAQQLIQPEPPSRIISSISNVSTKNTNTSEYIYSFLKPGFGRCWRVHTAPHSSSTVVLRHEHRSLEKGCGGDRSWAGVLPAQPGPLHPTPRAPEQPPLAASHQRDAAFAPDWPLRSSATYNILKVVPKWVRQTFILNAWFPTLGMHGEQSLSLRQPLPFLKNITSFFPSPSPLACAEKPQSVHLSS